MGATSKVSGNKIPEENKSEEKKNLALWIMHFHLLEDFFSEDFFA